MRESAQLNNAYGRAAFNEIERNAYFIRYYIYIIKYIKHKTKRN